MTRSLSVSTWTFCTPGIVSSGARPQFADAFIAVFAFGGDLDRFQDRVICVFRIMWVGGVHLLVYARRVSRGRLRQYWLEDAPDILCQDTLTSSIRMDPIPLVERRISADAFEQKRDQGRP